ncbi:DJ-1/PfpI family protein [Sorangium sp. So ce513]|jgi:transcriptional regulator GlxA family with amidase domain|uniref:DJ-1/PfpI family protein n=1 Tax=Sorangium sp. So ce513 TaxID=3133315 RepID=UPI003F636F34
MQEKRQIAFLIYPDMTPLDLIGPLQVIKSLERFGAYEVVTVGERLEPVPTDVGVAMQPERTFEQVPSPFALVVPGGLVGPITAIANDRLMAYVRAAGRSAEVLGSVCTGSIILAAAGLLEGRSATTHWTFLEHLGRLGAVPVRKRWVEDGKAITAAGVAAGIDMAIALVARLAGNDVARTIQAIIEYDPEPPLGPIDWRWVEDAKIGPTLLAGVTPALREILAGKPELAKKLFP